MNRCSTCRHYVPYPTKRPKTGPTLDDFLWYSDWYGDSPAGGCGKLWGDTDETAPVFLFTQDGTPSALIIERPEEFGCTLWSEK